MDSDNKIRHCFIYQDTLNRVYEIHNNLSIYLDILSSCWPLLENIFAANTKFNFKFLTELSIENTENEDNYRMIEFATINSGDSYIKVNMFFYWNTIEKNTIFIEEINIGELQIPEITVKNILTVISQEVEKYLKNVKYDVHNEESIIINTNMNNLIQVLSDNNLILKLLPKASNVIEFNGPVDTTDSILIVKDNNGKSRYVLRVVNVDLEDDRISFRLESSTTGFPLKEVCFDIYYIEDFKCVVNLKHSFIEQIKEEYFDKLSFNKRELLYELKQALETNIVK